MRQSGFPVQSSLRFTMGVVAAVTAAGYSLADDVPQGEWIGFNPVLERRLPATGAESRLDWQGARWIWTDETEAGTRTTSVKRCFRWTFTVPDKVPVKTAWIQMAADDSAQLFIGGHRRSETTSWQKPVEREVTEYLALGKNVFCVQAHNGGGPGGWAIKLVVEFTDGTLAELTPGADDVVWSATVDDEGKWTSPQYAAAGWKPVAVLGEMGIPPWGKLAGAGYRPGTYQSAPAPILRRSFMVEKPLARATLQSSGLGCHEVYCNGGKVGNAVLDPAMTQYDKSVLFVEHDVTGMLKPGRNALAVMLGHGWFGETSATAWNFERSAWHDRPKLLLTLRLEFQDGTTATILSDTSWKAAAGPVLVDDLMNGEIYDPRVEPVGWTAPDFDDSAWANADGMKPPGGRLVKQTMAPMRVTETIKPVKVWEARPGVFIYDLGQNIPGWARIRVQGPAGTEVRLRFAEFLSGNRLNCDMGGLIWSGWYQQDRYVLEGTGVEEWEPRFTYHGFRYVEVEGWPGTPRLDDLDGRVVHTDFPSAGSFECSDPLVNKIQSAVRWSYRGNFHGFPTDCPTREKKGWTGDAHLACEQAMFNWDNKAGYEKWLRDFTDVQDAEGRLKVVIPTAGWGGEACDWNVASVLIPWTVYEYTGDRKIVAESYPTMKRWVEHHVRRFPNFIIDDGVSDWSPAKTRTPKEITSTCFFHGAVERMATMADLLGKSDDAAAFRTLAGSVRQAFVAKFLKPDGTVGEGSQSSQACAIYFGLIPREQQAAVVNKLSAAVTAANDHVDVGILGAKPLFRVLSDHGFHDQAWRVVQQKTDPGYGWMMERGFTTLAEDWHGGGSNNHIMFGDISGWFYSYLAGIRPDPDQPGFRHFFLRPMPAGDLAWVRAEHRSPHGVIRSAWERKPDGAFTATFTVPQGTTATVILPDGRRQAVAAGDHSFAW